MPKSVLNTTRAAYEEVVLNELPDNNNEATNKEYVDSQITSEVTSHSSDSTIHFTEASIDHTNIQNIGTYSHNQIDTHINGSSVHGLSSNVVGESDTQTLSNKTLTAPSISGNMVFDQGTYSITLDNDTVTENRTIAFGDVDMAPEDGSKNYVVFQYGEQTMKEKSFEDFSTYIFSRTNNNRKVQFSLSGYHSDTTSTITIPLTDVSLGQIDTNETDIATNATNISTNASNLTSHEADTSTHGVTEIVGTSESQVLTNKSIDADSNTITNIDNADIKSGAAINASKIANGSVSNTEFQYINSLTSNVQTQINNHLADTSTHGVTEIVGTSESQVLTNKELTSPIINEILDPVNDSTVLSFSGVGPVSPVNYFTIGNADSGQNPTIIATSGTDANVNIEMRTKGSGDYSFKVGSTERVGISGQQLLISTGSSGSPALAFLDETTTGIWRTLNTMRFGLQGTESFRINVSSQLVLVKAGSNGTPSLCFDDDADTGMYSSADNTIDFTCGGDEVLSLKTVSASAVNYLQITNGTGVPIIETIGDGGNIPLDISTKGTGTLSLQVGGSDVLQVNSNDQTVVQAGTISLPGITFSGDANTGIYSSGDDIMDFTCGSHRVLSMTTGGSGDYIKMASETSNGTGPVLSTDGGTNVPLVVESKGTGGIYLKSGGNNGLDVENSQLTSHEPHYFTSSFNSGAGSTSNHEWAIYLNKAASGSWYGGFVMSSDDLLLASNRTGSAANTPAQLGNSGSWAAASQRSLKKDINEVTGVYENLKNIGVYNYRMKCEDTSVTRELEIGLIADEVVEYYPELVVNADKPDSNMAITYDRVSVLAVQGVKELGEKVEVLESTIQDLQDQIKNLQNTLAML